MPKVKRDDEDFRLQILRISRVVCPGKTDTKTERQKNTAKEYKSSKNKTTEIDSKGII